MKDKQKIKVLHIASGDLWAGAEVQLFTLVSSLNKLDNIHLHVILLNHGALEKKLSQQHIKVTVIDETKINGLMILLQLILAVKKIQPDVIHTHRIKENILGCFSAFINGNIASIRTAHGAPEHKPDWFHIPKRLILFIDWFCARFQQKKIVAVSQDLAHILSNSYPKHKIVTIENGVDINAFTKKTSTSSTITADNHEFKIAIAGRLVPVKRMDILITAASQLKATHPEINFSVYIYGDGPLLNELKYLCKHLHIEDTVYFKGHCENLDEELTNADVLLMTSEHEGLPMILLEAMAKRLPIISHAVGGIPALLDNGDCGILVKENRPELYTEAIHKIIIQPQKREQISQLAYIRLQHFYSAETNAKNYHNLYKSLCQTAR